MILVISHFYLEGRTLVLMVPVLGNCLHFSFNFLTNRHFSIFTIDLLDTNLFFNTYSMDKVGLSGPGSSVCLKKS